MDATDETVIEFRKSGMIIPLVGCCGSLVFGIWLFVVVALEMSTSDSPISVLVAGFGLSLAYICISGVCGLLFAKHLIKRGHGLVLNSVGFVDRSSPIAYGFIPWEDIASMSVWGNRFLIIRVVKPMKYVGRGHALRRAWNYGNWWLSGSPIFISPRLLKVKLGDLVSLFADYIGRYGHASGSA